jgi:hypothetical protein
MRQVMSSLVTRAFAEYDMGAAQVMGARVKLAAMEDWHEGAPGGWELPGGLLVLSALQLLASGDVSPCCCLQRGLPS